MQQAVDLLEFFDVTNEELLYFKENNLGLHRVDTSQLSTLLLCQLVLLQKNRSLNTFSITDVLQGLEGVGLGHCAKAEDQFKHTPLKGLWKAHFSDPHFLVQNISNHWGLSHKSSPKFLALSKKIEEEEAQNPTPYGWQGRLAHELVVTAYTERASQKKLTGEWLIFGKYNRKNYYLAVAGHSSSNAQDEEIFSVLKHYCNGEFPFLFSETNE
jgi:hypothetical protein